MPKILNIAVVGAGTMAQAVHLPVLRRRWDRFSVAALVDHSPRRRREASEVWGIEEERRYETVADLVAAVRARTLSLDGVLLSTDGLHVDDLLAIVRRGIPVMVEPPLGYSEEEIAKVAEFERIAGRRLVMLAHPQQYDDSVARMSEHIATKDLRMVDHEVLMPASQPLFGQAHVTTSSYDLPTEQRTARRKALQAAVEAGTGDGATQRDRDLYVKGLLTGVAHQMAVTEGAYGPIEKLVAVRHWPKGVIPGSIELLGELGSGAQVRLVWHYLPFAPEYSETLRVLSARRRMRLDLPAPSHGDARSTVSLREKKSGVVQEVATTAPKGSAELMWEAFHAFVEKGEAPLAGAAEALRQVVLLREVLATIVEADGRSLEAEPEQDSGTEEAPGAEEGAEAEEPSAQPEEPSAESATANAVRADEEPADGASAPSATVEVELPGAEPAPETLEQPVTDPSGEQPAAAHALAEPAAEPSSDPTPGRAPEATPVAEPARETLEQPAAPSTEEVVDAWSGGAESAPAAAEDAPPATVDPAVPEDPRR
ncbi:Gfo/Idh/MocA family protein [Brachybacterium paraconglomeratum]|uniref:Gfo/Idh/MocA family protein n=1 Tax=Brachybacterium paraconglomeratum TaxID=173362 RepID=UPI00026C7563|nr:Gfo/Idh/MocA family oxidoreductase [Brachybacterium paraconglomeratum]